MSGNRHGAIGGTRRDWRKNLFSLVIPLLLFAGWAARANGADPLRAGQLEDVQVFRRDFLNVDRSYGEAARREAERRLAAVEQRNTALDPLAFRIEICRIAALADNGHTRCLRTTPRMAPLEFSPFGGRFYLTGADKEDTDLLGASLARIDGHPTEAITQVGRSLTGGVDAWRDADVAKLLRTPADLHALGLAQSAEFATYVFRFPDGHDRERKIASLDAAAAYHGLIRLPLNTPQPWTAEEPNKPLRMRDAPELDAVVVQLRSNSDNGAEHIADFLGRAEEERVRQGRSNIVLDMRSNGGGDFLLTRDFFIRWPARLPSNGCLFVLEGAHTFSAAISGVAYLKQSGRAKVILVGGPPGDRLIFFAEGKTLTLPHSGISLLPATERHDYHDGCRKFNDCSADVAQPGRPTAVSNATVMAAPRIPISVKSLDPDIKAESTIGDIIAGRDRGMLAIATYLRDRHSER